MGIGEVAPLAAKRAAVGEVDLDVHRRRRRARLDSGEVVDVLEKLPAWVDVAGYRFARFFRAFGRGLYPLFLIAFAAFDPG